MKWEYATAHHNLANGSLSRIWDKGTDDDQPSTWDMIEDFGIKGWELVSTTSLGAHGNTDYLLFMFKRPKPE